jgi:CubicO group peptidase (beta-lactamase class C family)
MPATEVEPLVDGIVRAAMARDHLAGVTLSIVQDGQVVLKKGYGYAAPGRPVDPDRTLFRIGSLSKTFTWIAAMKEVEAGRMQLDKPLNQYLPAEIAIPDVPGWRQVELRDAMSHNPGFEERVLDHLFARTPADIHSQIERLKLNREKRLFAPGTTLAYSNLGVILTGAAVAHLEGADFQDVIDREITGPLGMKNTTFREPYPRRADLPAPMPAALAANLSNAYSFADGRLQAEPLEWLSQAAPAGGGSSTADDMTRYLLMMLGDGQLGSTRIYGAATALAFRTPIPSARPNGARVNHGFLQTALPGGFTGYGHDGDTLYFHSNLVTVPALKLGIFVSTNTTTGQQLVRELPQLLVEHFYAWRPPESQPGSPALAAKREVYAGSFASNRRAFSGLEKFVGLMTRQASIDVTPDGYLVTQNGGVSQTWAPTAIADRFQAVGGTETIDFALRDGKAVRWYEPDGTVSYDRVGLVYERKALLLLVALAGAAAFAALIGPAIRFRRMLPATPLQRRIDGVQMLASAVWLFSLVATMLFVASAEDQGQFVFNWPGTSLLAASSAALFASLLSICILIALPFVWTSKEGWRSWRKLRFSATTVFFCLVSLQLACWGFLEPWAA